MKVTKFYVQILQAQPDGAHKFILNYQDHFSKFCVLRPLKSKHASAVAEVLLEIFTLMGPPAILQSDNGREFKNKEIVDEVIKKWPGLKMVHGKPRHSQSQGSVERANRDIENLLACWQAENDSTNWAQALNVSKEYKIS